MKTVQSDGIFQFVAGRLDLQMTKCSFCFRDRGKVSVKVPSADIEDKTQSFSSVHGSSGSSGADTF
ncbi:hypothetical protein E2320_021719 [Naja naja]|nr:hypothetical protein E2320_021719 [Naja naja]